MTKHKKIFLAIFAIIIFILAWAPWMADDGGERVIQKVAMEKSSEMNGQVYDKDGNLLCDGLYSTWAPFGRWVSNCESGWYVTFWGQIFW